MNSMGWLIVDHIIRCLINTWLLMWLLNVNAENDQVMTFWGHKNLVGVQISLLLSIFQKSGNISCYILTTLYILLTTVIKFLTYGYTLTRMHRACIDDLKFSFLTPSHPRPKGTCTPFHSCGVAICFHFFCCSTFRLPPLISSFVSKFLSCYVQWYTRPKLEAVNYSRLRLFRKQEQINEVETWAWIPSSASRSIHCLHWSRQLWLLKLKPSLPNGFEITDYQFFCMMHFAYICMILFKLSIALNCHLLFFVELRSDI